MLTIKQIELSLKRTNDKITRLKKELTDLQKAKLKLSSDLKTAKASAPKKAVKKTVKKKK